MEDDTPSEKAILGRWRLTLEPIDNSHSRRYGLAFGPIFDSDLTDPVKRQSHEREFGRIILETIALHASDFPEAFTPPTTFEEPDQ